MPKVEGLTVSVLQTLTSGVPVRRDRAVATQPYVTNPGYLTPPPATGTAAVTYYFTPRDAFHTEGERRTDLAVSYNFGSHRLGRVQPFAQLQVLNLFNQFQLCGCGSGRVRQRRRGDADAHRSDRPDGVDQRVAVHGVQSVQLDAGGGHELGAGTELRHGAEPLRVHDAEAAAGDLRRPLLGCGVCGGCGLKPAALAAFSSQLSARAVGFGRRKARGAAAGDRDRVELGDAWQGGRKTALQAFPRSSVRSLRGVPRFSQSRHN